VRAKDLRTGNVCAEDLRADYVRAENLRTENLHTEDVCAEGLRAEGVCDEDMRAENAQTEGLRTENVCAAHMPTRPGDSRRRPSPGSRKAFWLSVRSVTRRLQIAGRHGPSQRGLRSLSLARQF